MAIHRLFKSSLPSMSFIFKNGKAAMFINGRYHTDDPSEIEQLDTEIKTRNPYLRIDEAERELDTELQDPMQQLKERFREEIIKEYLENEMRAINPENDFGDYDQSKINPASTTSIAPVSAGGDASRPNVPASLQRFVKVGGATPV
jgi:hypothetical protein